MEFKKKVLDNGLTIIGEVNGAAKSAAVGFFVKTGSRDESMDINGVSHFLEHMLFKGTDKLSALEVNEAFDRTGAQFNAFTSEENTVFYAAVLPEYMEEVTELWSHLMRPALRTDDFDMEKNVIKEEIAMYQDMPTFDVMDRCRHLHFAEHPCSHSVLGSDKSIDGMSADQMRGYFSGRYAPNNIVVCCAGDFDFEKISSLVEQGCCGWVRQKAGREISDFAGSGKAERFEKANLSCEHICLMNRAVAAQDERRFAAAVLGAIIGDDVGSRFFWELVDKAIAETASMQYVSMDGTGAYYSYIRCSSENRDKVIDIVRGILEKVGSDGVSEEEADKAKNKMLSAVVLKNEISMGRLVELGFNWIYLGQYRKVEEDVKAIKAVSVADVCSLAAELKLDTFTEYSLSPAAS